jgi:hypothetical protein
MQQRRISAFVSLLILSATSAHLSATDIIVWDFGPSTGLHTGLMGAVSRNHIGGPPEIGDSQYFADQVSFPTATTVSGFNLFTSPALMPLQGSTYRVYFYGGAFPTAGSELAHFDVGAQSVDFMGTYLDEGGVTTSDIWRISLRFNPYVIPANTTVWVGAAALGWDCGTYHIMTPGDGSAAQFVGSSIVFPQPLGDLMFQLTVPEPTTASLVTLAGIVGWTARRRRSARNPMPM